MMRIERFQTDGFSNGRDNTKQIAKDALMRGISLTIPRNAESKEQEVQAGKEDLSPEGFTRSQQELADQLIRATVIGKKSRKNPETGKLETFKDIPMPLVVFAQDKFEFGLKLHETKPEAPLSPYFLNFRNLPDNVLSLTGGAMNEMQTNARPDLCVGVPKAGLDLAKAYSEKSGITAEDLLAKEESEAGRKIIEGEKIMKTGLKVRLIDDLVTEAHTKIEAVRALESMGYTVTDIFVLVDREQGGREQLEKEGITLKAVFTITQLNDYYLRAGQITKEQHTRVKDYVTQAKRIA